jgi:hypothetical protein
MSFATFSGPVRSGTVRYGSGENTGLLVLSQSATLPAAPGTKTVAVLPAGSQILNVIVDTTAQFNAGTTLKLGDGTTADKYMTAATITGANATNNRILQSVIDAQLVTGELVNIGTSDVTIVATTTSSTASAGAATVTIVYVQKAADGSEVPATP